jgi:hypothetical protein
VRSSGGGDRGEERGNCFEKRKLTHLGGGQKPFYGMHV